ncbi:permease of ABC transporter system [Bifidobacterium avesanii]|uniref:Permease of ABC transporter system n=1 Tax=Bifidobacterium avesanii TaxID=1798157 RepID=A0A7K3TFB5_9BIFI|nr:permease of ABC transporter system [Bifidobacterium avesanii]KAB8294457.1 ABC transporter permease [Bifidobacterium avesanii]NEG77712.1 permease of ABC transporter system [Bifidobacterium avesanii]
MSAPASVNPVPANNGYTTGRRMSAGRLRLSFLGSVRSEFTKLLSIKSTYWLLAITALLIVAGGAISAASYKAMAAISYDSSTGAMTTLDTPRPIEAASVWASTTVMVATASVVIGIFGVMAITSEYTNLTIQSGFVANPRRGMYLAAKGVVVALLAFATTLVGVGLAWVAARAVLGGVEITPLDDAHRMLPVICLIGAPAAGLVMAVMALGLGAICRSTVGGVFALIGLWSILPSVLGIASLNEKLRSAVTSIGNCLPSSVMGTFLAGPSEETSSSMSLLGVASTEMKYFDPTWWQAGLILLAWAAVAYALGALVLRRSDVK